VLLGVAIKTSGLAWQAKPQVLDLGKRVSANNIPASVRFGTSIAIPRNAGAGKGEPKMKSRPRLKYFAIIRGVFLGGVLPGQKDKLICTATSKRLALKIAVTLNLMESRQQKAHEVFCK
jgi:hypothetical protein